MQSFREETYFASHIPSQDVLERLRHRRALVFLRVAWGTLVITVLLTLIGLFAALWHMAWWIAAGFVGMILISILLIWIAIFSPATSRLRTK